MRVPVNHPDKEMSGVFVRGFCRWRSLGHRRDFPGTMDRMLFCIVPRTLVDNLSVKRLPARDVLFTVDKGKDGARNNGNVGAADDLEKSQCVLHFFVAPGVAGKDGNAEDVGLG